MTANPLICKMVGAAGFEPTTPSSPVKCERAGGVENQGVAAVRGRPKTAQSGNSGQPAATTRQPRGNRVKIAVAALMVLALSGCMARIGNCGVWLAVDFPPVGVGCF